MKNCLLIYYTGTGNTKKMVLEYEKIFKDHNIQSDLLEIKKNHQEIPEINQYNYLGIAFPVHAFNSPRPVEVFLKKLEIAKDKPYFILLTSGEPLSLNYASSLKVERIMKKKGYHLTNEYLYCMPYNIMFRHSENSAYKMFETAKKMASIDVKDIINGVNHYLKKSLFSITVRAIFRIEQPGMHLNGRLFKIDEEKCIHCLKCVRECPEQNISYDKNQFHFGNNCDMCAKCAFFCPANAINIGLLNNWKVNGEYKFIPEKEGNDKHSSYLKKSYKKYYDKAEKRIKNNS
ncbi:MAG: 4Fe-4S binding protein [Bacillales bacterium]|nr:4Fe-4S binding protein [Bacillales bacterium]